MLGRVLARVVEAARHGAIERVDEQRRLAAARDAGDAGEEAERNFRRDVLQVVAAGADDLEAAHAVGLAALLGQRDLAHAGEVLAGEAVGVGHDVVGRALGDDLAAVHAGAGADVDDVVGLHDRVLVVLDDDDGVADVAQVLERDEQAVVVALMQPDGGLVST